LIRVMVEAPSEEETDAICERISRALEEALPA
jgi:phosphomannomutase